MKEKQEARVRLTQPQPGAAAQEPFIPPRAGACPGNARWPQLILLPVRADCRPLGHGDGWIHRLNADLDLYWIQHVSYAESVARRECLCLPCRKINSAVSEIAAADPVDAQRHFERLLSLETDCWDVHAAIAGGHPDFVILDVRSPALYAAGHVPGAINLPHGRINERNLRGSPPKCCSWCTATDRTATAPIEARLDWAAWGGR
jgi:hypothetical protein